MFAGTGDLLVRTSTGGVICLLKSHAMGPPVDACPRACHDAALAALTDFMRATRNKERARAFVRHDRHPL